MKAWKRFFRGFLRLAGVVCGAATLMLSCPSLASPQVRPQRAALLQDMQDRHPWDKDVNKFRRDHHFAFSLGIGQGLWQIGHLGAISERIYQSDSFYGKFQYSFHLPVWGRFGYFLGSSFGYLKESPSNSNVGFKPASAIHLPGFLVGVVWTFNPAWRIMLGLDHYLERFEDLEEQYSSPPHKLSITMQVLMDTMVMLDFFYQLNWAVRIEGHWRRALYEKPKEALGKVEDASFQRTDYWAGLGVVYHLL